MLRRILMIAGGVMATTAAAVFVWSKRRAELDAVAARATGRDGKGRGGRHGAGPGDRPGAGGARGGGERRDVGLTPLSPKDDGGDDLRTVKGIGRVSAERLRAKGIATFAQIAAWSEGDLDAIAQEVGISAERIRREDWVGQARAIVEGAA